MTEGERLKEIRKALGLTQKELSEALEIKQGSYSDVERGKAGISALLLKNLIRLFRINPLWLTEGEGVMFIGYRDLFSDETIDPKKHKAFGKQSVHNTNSIIKIAEVQIDTIERQKLQMANITSIIDFLNEEE